jgi:hypothetical protein
VHTHTTNSDGGVPVADAIAAYRDHGYDFLAITDHFLERYRYPITDTRTYQTSAFVTLLGAELHAPQTELGDLWHIVAAGLPTDFAPPTAGETGPQLAARARAAGAFVGMAHPAWYTLTLQDGLSLEAAHAVEIFNQTCATDNDRGESWYMSDQLSVLGHRLLAYAADDAHFRTRPDVRAAWVQVRAEALDPDAILGALKAGHFYASQGPELRNVAVEGKTLQVECSPVSAVFVSGRGPRCQSQLGAGIERATLDLSLFQGSYCRVTVIDAAGKRAWTNPIWLD